LRDRLRKIDGRGYKAYKSIKGDYGFSFFTLSIDHVQGDPYAAPSRVRILVGSKSAGFKEETYREPSRRVALEDKITRMFAAAVGKHVSGRRGSGKSGKVSIDFPGQEILERTSCFVYDGDLEVRFVVGLPAGGRRILARQAEEIFFDEIPAIAREALVYGNIDQAALERHLDVNEDQDFIRKNLKDMGLIAFIAEGSILPRRSGIDDRPMKKEGGMEVVPFRSPETMLVTLDTPHAGEVRGMGIPEGITLVAGGGFHGKSTLLKALERGVYNHVPGDGRELVVTREDAVKIRSEDGRSVRGVDISPFISNLPFGVDTEDFNTVNASGSTSQAANIVEALEAGSRFLLIDEDTSATNFMIRDERMQALVAKDREPITPFIDRVKDLYEKEKVSTVLVMGGSGDYFNVAHRVIMMDTYLPYDVTSQAEEIVRSVGTGRVREGGEGFKSIAVREPLPNSFDPSRGRRKVKIKAAGLDRILFGRHEIDLSAVEQLVSVSQTRAIGYIINYYYRNYCSRGRTLFEGLNMAMEQIGGNGLDRVTRFRTGDLALPRIYEVAAAINRLRTLKTRKSR